MRIEDFLERLEAVHGTAPQWTARCPAHDDRQASLTIGLGDEGKILITCWAGCELEDICQAAGVTVADLFDQEAKDRASLGLGARLQRAMNPLLPGAPELERDQLTLLRSLDTQHQIRKLKGWNYTTLAALDVGMRGNRLTIPVRDLNGEIVQYLRYWPESQPKMLATKGHRRTPLYALLDTGPVWIVEGETDAISIACAGFAVIGAPGASAKAHSDWCEPVRGRDVIVCMDYDEPGNKAALKWARSAAARGAASVKIVTFVGRAPAFDVSDLLLELHGDPARFRAALLELEHGAEPFEEELRAQHMPTPAPNHDDAEPGEIVTRSLSSYRVQRLPMLWRERIPVGRVGIIYGPPGQGKSTLLALIVADVTQAGGKVLIASGDENDPATTLLPRMAAAGADVGLVDLMWTKAVKGETELVLPRDLDALGIRMKGAAMLLIDPLSAHFGDTINPWKEQEVRSQILAPLAYHARGTGCAVPYVSHMNKSNGTDPLSRISGSGGFGAAARFALLLGSHPDDIGLEPAEQRLVLVHVKANESARQPAIVFRRRIVGIDSDNEVAAVPVLEIEDDRAQISPEAVLEHTDPEEAGAFTQALEFLKSELSNGPKPSKQLLTTARQRGDFSERTLRKAKHALKVKSEREGSEWWWVRPA